MHTRVSQGPEDAISEAKGLQVSKIAEVFSRIPPLSSRPGSDSCTVYIPGLVSHHVACCAYPPRDELIANHVNRSESCQE